VRFEVMLPVEALDPTKSEAHSRNPAWSGRAFGLGLALNHRITHAAALSSLSAPRATIFSVSSGRGLCSAFASSQGACIHNSRSSLVVKITGMALGWIGSTIAFGEVRTHHRAS
jgi:hypothetical protein